MKLSELKTGDVFSVLSVNSKGEIAKRLVEMGFTKNSKGSVKRSALFDDPIEITISGYDISIRKSEAEMIEVQND